MNILFEIHLLTCACRIDNLPLVQLVLEACGKTKIDGYYATNFHPLDSVQSVKVAEMLIRCGDDIQGLLRSAIFRQLFEASHSSQLTT